MIIGREVFFSFQAKLDYIPFSQTEEWLDSNYANYKENIVYFIDSLEKPRITCFGICLKKRFIGEKLMIDGISFSKEVSSDNIREFFKSIIDMEYSMITLSDIHEYSPEFEVGYRRAGFVRPLALSLCPMSMIVELQRPFSFHRNWKRNVKKSKDIGNQFHIIESPTLNETEDFIKLFNQLKQRKSLGFSLNAEQLMILLKGNYKLFYLNDNENKKIAGRIVYVKGKLVYDVYAANSNEAIKTGASYHLQEGVLNYYRELGYEEFDYGRISPSADAMDNIYMSKSYSGGRPISYNGEWYYGKSLLINYIYVFFKHIIRKQRIY